MLLLLLVLVSLASAFKASFKIIRNRNRKTANMIDTSKQTPANSEEADKMLSTIEALLKAVEAGNIEELKKQGFSISSKNEAEALLERISDPVLRDQILGQISIDELELIEDMKRVSINDSFEGYEGGDIDKTLF